MYKLTKEETETTIAFTKADNEAIVYTSMKDWIRRLDRYCTDSPDIFRNTLADEYSKTYTVPARCVKITKPRKINQQDNKMLTQRMKTVRSYLKK